MKYQVHKRMHTHRHDWVVIALVWALAASVGLMVWYYANLWVLIKAIESIN